MSDAEQVQPGDSPAVPPQGDPMSDVVVVPVIDVHDGSGAAADDPGAETAEIEQVAAEHLAELKRSLGDLQLSGMAATGVPAVDEALARLGDLDPDDLTGSARVLEDVLARLEGALGESPQD